MSAKATSKRGVLAITKNGDSAKAKSSGPAKPRTNSTEPTVIQPLSDRVLIQALDAKATLKSGIIIPDTAKERPQEGRVIAVGPGRMSDDGKRIAPEVKKGDAILYGKYSGTEIKLDDTEYLILRETDILAIL